MSNLYKIVYKKSIFQFFIQNKIEGSYFALKYDIIENKLVLEWS